MTIVVIVQPRDSIITADKKCIGIKRKSVRVFKSKRSRAPRDTEYINLLQSLSSATRCEFLQHSLLLLHIYYL